MNTSLLAGLVLLGAVCATSFSQSPSAQEAAAAYFTPKEIDDGHQFSFERRVVFWLQTFIELAFLVVLVYTPAARYVADRVAAVTAGNWLSTLLTLGALLFVVQTLIGLPFSLIRFYQDRAWQLTTRTLDDWLSDYYKALALSAVLGGVVVVGLYQLMRWFPDRWWLPAAVASVGLGVLLAWLHPILIAPVFNTFEPIGKSKWSALEPKVKALADKAGVAVGEILVMDGSRQGGHTNAYFTGFGPSKRIVLFDTLLQKHSDVEIETILAHEMGHWLHNHIIKGLILGAVGGLLGLWLLAHVLTWNIGKGSLCLQSPSDPAGLPLILLIVVAGSWLTMPLEMAVSRYFERQADAMSLELAGHPDDFIQAEIKLARDNVSNVAPAPFNVWFFASHPPAVERIRMAEDWKKQHMSQGSSGSSL